MILRFAASIILLHVQHVIDAAELHGVKCTDKDSQYL